MRKKGNTQTKLINELKTQLLTQAERLGVKDDYTPVFMEETKLDAVRKILGEFYMERSNLEYELNMSGTDKRELVIKLERLNSYIRKAEGIREKHLRILEEQLGKGTGDKQKTRRALNKINPVKVSVST